MTNVVAKQISPEHQQAIADILGAMFGTPDKPVALAETGLKQKWLDMAAGPVWTNKGGEKHGLYRRHCVHCHGINGDGMGPTSASLNPYPRDYRPGVFKFKSTYTAAAPTNEDLTRILHDGVPGTAMPSFALLPDDEIDALVEYVKYLSIRGQMETALEGYVADELNPGDKFDPAGDPAIRALVIDTLLGPIMESWNGANEQVIIPTEDAIPKDNRTPQEMQASIAAGRELFYGTRANCVKCHGPTGIGDGQQDDYDNWSKANNDFIKATNDKIGQIQSLKADLEKAQGDDVANIREQIRLAQKEYNERRELIASILPPRNAIPRNLREGSFRGGRRPIDVFWRISAGIAGTPMPASGPAAEGAQGTLKQEEIWQIVEYVHSLPFEPASRPQKKLAVNTQAVSTGE
jgi:mono/diheme cytochrome c family protein